MFQKALVFIPFKILKNAEYFDYNDKGNIRQQHIKTWLITNNQIFERTKLVWYVQMDLPIQLWFELVLGPMI
jgi:hypothetical protein